MHGIYKIAKNTSNSLIILLLEIYQEVRNYILNVIDVKLIQYFCIKEATYGNGIEEKRLKKLECVV